MHRSKAFFKKTRRGKIHRIVSDHYLRDDIGCGSLAGKPVSKVRYEMNRDFVKCHEVDILSYVVWWDCSIVNAEFGVSRSSLAHIFSLPC